MNNNSVLILSHVSDLSGPTEALEQYVRHNFTSSGSIVCPLEYCTSKTRRMRRFQNGEVVNELVLSKFKKGKLLTWAFDFFITLYRSWRFGRVNVIIACDPLMALPAIILKWFGRVEHLILYSIDWSDRRFSNSIFNRFYYAIDRFILPRTDVVWCVSKTIQEIRKKQGAAHAIHVPVGVYIDQITQTVNYDKNILVFLGAFEKTKGIELLIEIWPDILKINPEAKLICIGKTPKDVTDIPYEKQLQQLDRVECIGVLEHQEILNILPKFGVGLAPYSSDSHSISKYADPSRVKDYLGCGLPVLITDVPPIHLEIQNKNGGVVCNFNKNSIITALQTIWLNYGSYRACVKHFVNELDWKKIFTRAFSESTL